MRNSFLLLSACLFLASCGGLNKLTTAAIETKPVGPAGVTTLTLSSAQQKVVSDGVREMISKVTVDGGESAKLIGFKAFQLPSSDGVHVCGDVSYQVEPGKPTLTVPYYLEIEELQGAPSAKRGQVGSDKLKKSKVVFMCRHVNKS